jgi:hypothetical protein
MSGEIAIGIIFVVLILIIINIGDSKNSKINSNTNDQKNEPSQGDKMGSTITVDDIEKYLLDGFKSDRSILLDCYRRYVEAGKDVTWTKEDNGFVLNLISPEMNQVYAMIVIEPSHLRGLDNKTSFPYVIITEFYFQVKDSYLEYCESFERKANERYVSLGISNRFQKLDIMGYDNAVYSVTHYISEIEDFRSKFIGDEYNSYFDSVIYMLYQDSLAKMDIEVI